MKPICGIHGSGKTTFCKTMSKKTGLKTYSASDLISRRIAIIQHIPLPCVRLPLDLLALPCRSQSLRTGKRAGSPNLLVSIVPPDASPDPVADDLACLVFPRVNRCHSLLTSRQSVNMNVNKTVNKVLCQQKCQQTYKK